MINIDKQKLVLVHNKEDYIVDQSLDTKEIGYYRDSWNRFKRNRVSLVAFIIICVMLFFVIFGPLMKNYKLYDQNSVEARRIGYLTPKIPVLEKLGIFDGTKTINAGKEFLIYMENSDFGNDIIISGFPDELRENPKHPDYSDVYNLTVKVDYYKYVNYVKSYMPEDYFSIVESNKTKPEGSKDEPLQSVIRQIDEATFKEHMAKNYIIDVIRIDSNNQYHVRYNQFLLALDQTPEDTYFWFGTTSAGKDLFTEIWKGAQISLVMALMVVIVNTTIGLLIGSAVGYYGGVLDLLFDRFVEILVAIPFLPVLTLLTLRFGAATWVIILAFTVTGWIGSYGTGRMQFYRFKNREYVLAARTLGASDARIMFKHIFPNTLGLIITGIALSIPTFVFTEASYAFLGIISYTDATSVGMLIQQGQSVMQAHSHLLIYPSIYIAILMIAFNLFGNGLRDAFNPSLRGVE